MKTIVITGGTDLTMMVIRFKTLSFFLRIEQKKGLSVNLHRNNS
jgi:hypothetical protein